MSYVLEQGEVILLRDERVIDSDGRPATLLLTNRNIIKIRENGRDSYFSLSQLRESNGSPNVLVGKGSNGKSRLELYFEQSQQVFSFRGLMVEKKWASAITKAYKARMKEIAKSERKGMSPGKLLAPVKDRIDAAKESLLQHEQRATSSKCPYCGAITKGHKGEEVKCGFCESTFVIK